MPIAYDPNEPFTALFTGKHNAAQHAIWRTMRSSVYWGTLLGFVLLRITVEISMDIQDAKELDAVGITYTWTHPDT